MRCVRKLSCSRRLNTTNNGCKNKCEYFIGNENSNSNINVTVGIVMPVRRRQFKRDVVDDQNRCVKKVIQSRKLYGAWR